MFVTPAYAQAAGSPAAAGFDPSFFVPLILIFVVFYFLLIRPQQKKVKEHKEMVAALRRGDKVVTQGGLIGTITKIVNDDEALVEIGEGIRVRLLRSAISNVVSKTEPASSEKEKSGKDKGKNGDSAKSDEAKG